MMNPIIEVANSKRSVDYIFASMTSELEKILNDDTLQARVKVFDDLQETKNLTPDECPRGVFRSPTPGEVNCEPKVFMELVKTLQYFEKIYK